MTQGGTLTGGVIESLQQQRTLGDGPAQHGVDQARRAAAPGLGLLDGLVDGGVGGDPVTEQQLVETEAKDGEDRRIERADRPPGQCDDDVVEGVAALDGPVGQAGGQRPLARLQAGGLARQRPIRPRPLLEHSADDRQRIGPRG